MTTNEDTIFKFYTAFSNGDAAQMCECYHANIKFSDPVFGLLKGNDVCKMWKMLLEKSKGNIKIDFSEIKDYLSDYPGVCSKNDLEYYLDNCSNPNLLLKIH